MQALVYDGSLRLRSDLPVPSPAPGEALIRVRAAGICNTDLEIVRGYMGFHGVLGHEFVGEVVAADDASWLGQRVCGEINAACGSCRACRSQLRSHCSARTVLGILGRDGAFAEYLTLPLLNLHPIPPQIEDERAVFVEPVAAAYQILEQIEVRASDMVVVLGDGKLGILCAQVLAATGCDLLVVGRHESKLALLRRLGIRAQRAEDVMPEGADVVVEVTGSSAGFQQAVQMLRPRGTLVLKSTVAGTSALNLAPLVVNEITVVGSRCGPFPRAIAALLHGSIDVEPLISARYGLGDGLEAMDRASAPGVVKVLLDVAA